MKQDEKFARWNGKRSFIIPTLNFAHYGIQKICLLYSPNSVFPTKSMQFLDVFITMQIVASFLVMKDRRIL